MTELLFLRDAYQRECTSTVVDIRDNAVVLDKTIFYYTGGGQPHDTGVLGGNVVVDVRKDGDDVLHYLIEGAALPSVGDVVECSIDWDRRHQLMRTHTAMHVLCGVIWNEWKVPVTGGNMEPLSARMDFELPEVPESFLQRVEQLVNEAVTADYPIEVSFLPRDTAVEDEDLIRTKVSLIPVNVKEIRVVDIVGLDKQADGGTHVASTTEVGSVRVVKMENKGKGFRRLRVEIS
ncbi:MAG: alanyl-tRNA editing protein [Ilumatobacteraceae bacterium]